jgi:hypothetical protein
MNQNKLQQRLKIIEEAIKKTTDQIAQLNANLNVLNGGKFECELWVKMIDQEAEELKNSSDSEKQNVISDQSEDKTNV